MQEYLQDYLNLKMSGSYELEGEKYGLNVIGNNFDLEIGYIDDNKTGDGTFANMLCCAS